MRKMKTARDDQMAKVQQELEQEKVKLRQEFEYQKKIMGESFQREIESAKAENQNQKIEIAHLNEKLKASEMKSKSLNDNSHPTPASLITHNQSHALENSSNQTQQSGTFFPAPSNATETQSPSGNY
jgi:hypothetical protein